MSRERDGCVVNCGVWHPHSEGAAAYIPIYLSHPPSQASTSATLYVTLQRPLSYQLLPMSSTFIPRTTFPTLTSLPRSYYLGHHAAGLQKMRTLLNQIDLIVECRDYRIPLTSRNPMFEDVLREKERVVVYTKKDLGSTGSREKDGKVGRRKTVTG